MTMKLLIDRSMLTEALAAWERDHRAGNTVSRDEVAAMTVEEVAAAAAGPLWHALEVQQPVPSPCSESERLAVLQSALRVLESTGGVYVTPARVIETALTVLSQFAAFPDSAGRGCSGAEKCYQWLREHFADGDAYINRPKA